MSIERFEIEYESGKIVVKQISEIKTQWDIHKEILSSLDEYYIEMYAEDFLGLMNEGDCECESDVTEISTDDLIQELEERGYKSIPCKTITEEQKINELIKTL